MVSWIKLFLAIPVSKTLRNPGNHTQSKQNQENYKLRIEFVDKKTRNMPPHSKIYVVAGGSRQDNLVPCTGPEKKQYISKAHRKKSFDEARFKPRCNGILKNKMDDLINAGFYYSRIQSDLVICFYCGGGLRGWKENDNPWIEHAAAYPECGFTKLIRGEKFIKACTEMDRGVVEADKWDEYTEFVEVESKRCAEEVGDGDEKNKDLCKDQGD